MQLVARLDEIAERYRVILCDLWGVYHDGVAPHAEAVDALRRMRQAGKAVILLTNAPRPHFSVARQLAAMDAPPDSFDGIVTSGDATIAALEQGQFGETCHHVGPPRDEDLFVDLGIERRPLAEADFILCSGLNDDATETPADYAPLIEAGMARDLSMLCANPDIVVDRGETRIFCAGAIAEAYEKAGGTALYYGKPHAPIYRLALDKAAELSGERPDPSAVLAIGDGAGTDIAGGGARRDRHALRRRRPRRARPAAGREHRPGRDGTLARAARDASDLRDGDAALRPVRP